MFSRYMYEKYLFPYTSFIIIIIIIIIINVIIFLSINLGLGLLYYFCKPFIDKEKYTTKNPSISLSFSLSPCLFVHIYFSLSPFVSLSVSHPPGDGQVVDARQVLPELQKLLEVLHLHHGSLQLEHHLRDISQGSWGGEREREK